ncbi:hypothetical protein G6F57_018573 [Rhizopus arrhizus]|nr:hypothetical protein G6F57_018573 [Rhizopus arrhizus]
MKSTCTRVACAWRTILVAASRSTRASPRSTSTGIGGGVVYCRCTCWHSSSRRAEASSPARALARMPVTALRTCASASRAIASASPISCRARASPRSCSLRASSSFNVISDRVWPSRS